MVPWTVEFLNDAVERELDDLTEGLQSDLTRISELLKQYGPQRVRMPYVRPLGKKLWEMRLRDETGIARALYTATTGRRLVILHVFRKTTEATPPRAIKLAMKRRKEME